MKYTVIVLLPLAGILLASLGSHYGLIPNVMGFLLFQISLLVGVFVFAGGILLLFRGVRQGGFVLTASGSLYFMSFLGIMMWTFSFPRISDVSTDVETPPAFTKVAELPENAGRDMTLTEPVKQVIKEEYTKLKGMEIPGKTYDEVYSQVVEIVKNNPAWSVVSASPESGLIEGVSTSSVFKFKDDFVIRVISLSSTPVIRVDMRSKSRVGKSDLGSNAKRILGFFLELETKLGLTPK